MPKGAGKTFKGNPLPEIFITRSDGDSHRYSDTDGADDVSGVTVFYYDNDKAKRQKVTVVMKIHGNFAIFRGTNRLQSMWPRLNTTKSKANLQPTVLAAYGN
jgi:phage protein D